MFWPQPLRNLGSATGRYVEEISLAAMLTAKRSAGVTLEVNLREHVIYMCP